MRQASRRQIKRSLASGNPLFTLRIGILTPTSWLVCCVNFLNLSLLAACLFFHLGWQPQTHFLHFIMFFSCELANNCERKSNRSPSSSHFAFHLHHPWCGEVVINYGVGGGESLSTPRVSSFRCNYMSSLWYLKRRLLINWNHMPSRFCPHQLTAWAVTTARSGRKALSHLSIKHITTACQRWKFIYNTTVLRNALCDLLWAN